MTVEIRNHFPEVTRKTLAGAKDAARDAVEMGAGVARSAAPVNTGALAASITTGTAPGDRYGIKATVPYAIFVEFGRKGGDHGTTPGAFMLHKGIRAAVDEWAQMAKRRVD